MTVFPASLHLRDSGGAIRMNAAAAIASRGDFCPCYPAGIPAKKTAASL